MKFQTERILIVFLLIVVATLSLRSCFRKERENIVLKEAVQIKEDSTSFWIDSLGRTHAQKRNIEADLASLRTLYHVQIDSLTAALEIKDKELQGVIMTSSSATAKVIPKVDTIRVDSSIGYKFRYNDKWLTLEGIISKDPYISYAFRDSLVLTTYTKRTGIFRKEVYVDGYSLNPNVRITNITGIRVATQNTSRLGFGPYVGYGWTGQKWQPNIGVSFHYSLIRF